MLVKYVMDHLVVAASGQRRAKSVSPCAKHVNSAGQEDSSRRRDAHDCDRAIAARGDLHRVATETGVRRRFRTSCTTRTPSSNCTRGSRYR
jgi:hypothetical protein